jgi:hypothetical protein
VWMFRKDQSAAPTAAAAATRLVLALMQQPWLCGCLTKINLLFRLLLLLLPPGWCWR